MKNRDNKRQYPDPADRLRSQKRIALLEIERVVSLSLKGLNNPRILDVGTGTAVFAEAFAAEGLNVSGIDPNPAMLEAAKSHAPGIPFKPGAAEAMPFGDMAFDLCFLGHVLHEVDDPITALREAHRVSTVRVAILEWPFLEEENGPPLTHRLAPEAVKRMASKVGLVNFKHVKLTYMDFYSMEREI